MRSFAVRGGLVLAAFFALASVASSADDAVQVKVVKYGGLGDTVLQLKGKVVVIDFWADT